MMEDVQMMGSMVIMIIYYKKKLMPPSREVMEEKWRGWWKSDYTMTRTKVEGCKMPAIKQEGWRRSKGKQKSQRQGQSVEGVFVIEFSATISQQLKWDFLRQLDMPGFVLRFIKFFYNVFKLIWWTNIKNNFFKIKKILF